MEFSDLTPEERAFILNNELFCNAIVCLKRGIEPVKVIYDLCKHIENINTQINEA